MSQEAPPVRKNARGSITRLAVRYSFAKLLTMKLLTCKIECEKVKKIIDKITCPYMNLWR